MAECSEIEAGGEVRTIKDATARSGVAANAAAIEAIKAVIPSTASASNKTTTMTEVKTLFATPIRLLLNNYQYKTAKIDNVSKHLAHVKVQLKSVIPNGYKLYKASITIAWLNSNLPTYAVVERMGTAIETVTNGDEKEVEFTLYTETERTPGSNYALENAYWLFVELIKE